MSLIGLEAVKELVAKCPRCNGRGYIDTDTERDVPCPECHQKFMVGDAE